MPCERAQPNFLQAPNLPGGKRLSLTERGLTAVGATGDRKAQRVFNKVLDTQANQAARKAAEMEDQILREAEIIIANFQTPKLQK